MAASLLRIAKEIKELQISPLEGIFIHPDEENIASIAALILGPSRTPYEDGFYFFRLTFPINYPHSPPKVKFLTTFGDTVRFNPNLYADGKVCLSILGTWSGPPWHSSMGIGSVLLSIQSLMGKEPYRNEPGREQARCQEVENYNKIITYQNLRVAIAHEMINPSLQEFKDIQARYFVANFRKLIKKAESLRTDLDGSEVSDPLNPKQVKLDYKSVVDGLNAAYESVRRPLDETLDRPGSPSARPYHSSSHNLQYELDTAQKKPAWGISIGAIDSCLTRWSVSITMPQNSPLEGLVVFLEARFPSNYPDAPPVVQFTSRLFHPNVSEDGIPCLTELQEWKPSYSALSVMVSLQALLLHPNIASFVNEEAASLYISNEAKYLSKLRRYLEGD